LFDDILKAYNYKNRTIEVIKESNSRWKNKVDWRDFKQSSKNKNVRIRINF